MYSAIFLKYYYYVLLCKNLVRKIPIWPFEVMTHSLILVHETASFPPHPFPKAVRFFFPQQTSEKMNVTTVTKSLTWMVQPPEQTESRKCALTEAEH